MNGRTALAAAALIAIAPQPASAHLVGVEFGDFYAGALHLLTGVGYLAALAGLSLLAGLQERASGRWALAATPPALAVGAFGAAALAAEGGAADSLALALAALAGMLAALGARLPQLALAGLAAAAGAAVGAANGAAAAGAPVDPWLYAAGVAASGGAFVILGVALARAAADRARLAVLVWRVWGSWIAAIGAAAFALALTQNGILNLG